MRTRKFAACAAALTLAMSITALADTYSYTQNTWWSTWTPSYELADGATLTFTGTSSYDVNNDQGDGPGLQNWKCINTILSNVKTDGTAAPNDTAGYAEYAALRVDNWGWGDCYDGSTNESNWDWDAFQSMISNASYTFTFTRSGNTVTETINVTGADGTTGYQKYTVNCSDSSIYVFFTADAGVTFSVSTAEATNTGDATSVAYLAAATLIAGASVIAFRKRRA